MIDKHYHYYWNITASIGIMICIVNASLILACVFVGPAIAFLGDIYYYFKYVSLVKIIIQYFNFFFLFLKF